MPIDLTGIQNENEFYSDHYLTTVFEGDIKETIDRWKQLKEEGGKAPHQDCRALATPYICAATEYRDTRDSAVRVKIFRKFTYDLLKALGYERQLQQPILSDGTWLSALHRASRSDGADHLWIIESLAPAGDDFVTDPLALDVPAELGPADLSALPGLRQGSYEDAITAGIFGLDQPPRFVLLLSMAQAILIDRNKWGESRLLRFDLTEIFSRKESATFQAVAALLHRDSLAPDTGTPLVDTIDEESHRHAHGVSKDLKYALREAIELIGNEASEQIVSSRKTAGVAAYQTREGKAALDARQLSLECLRYMYRLLFLFYIEARPDLGFAPMKSDAYRKGYSLESLRELELMPLTRDEEKDGHYLHESLNLLFRLIYDGTPYSNVTSDDEFSRDFDMRPVRTRLFDPDSTPMLSKVRFRNETLQRVIQLMSLSRAGQGRRGRISYAQLGINQLGAVYEALLSYSGFFAQTDLYEVKKAGEANPDPLEAAYFVPKADIDKYEKDEIVYDGIEPRIYPKGTFIYRLAGRDRENSASYYTPEILTRCLVKYTLKELLKDKTADDILKLTICEEELGERIPHDRYAYERQKVRAYITDRNTFGVDLNPIAMELGQVSLWLNCIHEGDFIPWFGDQLFAGNSLIGVRREVYPASRIGKKSKVNERWFKHAPRPLKTDAPRKPDEVYHFLLPDPSMADYKKPIVEPLAPEQFEKLKKWRKDFCTPLDADEIAQLERLSAVIDELFEENANALANERYANTDPLTVWGQPEEDGESTDFKAKNRRLAGMRGEGARNAVPYQRLKTAMDYWCSLWFWPLEHADLLPTRDEFLFDMTLILEGNILSSGADMFERENLLSGADPNKVDLFDQGKSYGQLDIKTLKTKSPRLLAVAKVAERARFFHWPVELGDVLITRGGFDFILGNPPWIKPEWKDKDILSVLSARLALRSLSAAQVDKQKPAVLNTKNAKESYLRDYAQFSGTISFLGSAQAYPLTSGALNLYKCFVCQSLILLRGEGKVALLHPISHLSDPKGQIFRKFVYEKLILHFQFSNELYDRMFADVGHQAKYSINVYDAKGSDVDFTCIANLFIPTTIDECFAHDGIGQIPGIKTIDDKWEVRGHSDRIVKVTRSELSVFSAIIDGPDASDVLAARICYPHSKDMLSALRKLGGVSGRLYNRVRDCHMDAIWGETTDTKNTGIIRRETGFKNSPEDMVITGPNFYVANPLAKTPRRNCSSKGDYDSIDLQAISDDYLPRCNYTPNVSLNEYRKALPTVPWEANKRHTDFYRLCFRRMTNSAHDRTLKAAILPKDIAHVHTVQSASFSEERDLINASALASSICLDFITKNAGISEVYYSYVKYLPWVHLSDTALHRALQLNCLTSWYQELWDRNAGSLVVDGWASDDPRVNLEGPDHATLRWTRHCGLRTDFARRQALLEIDVLVAIALGVTLRELIQMYSVQFPVMQSYDRNTWYDQNGRIVFTNSKNLSGVGLDRKTWEAHMDMKEGTVSKNCIDDTMPGGPVERTITYRAPFTLPNREEDYERAWSVFYPKFASRAAA